MNWLATIAPNLPQLWPELLESIQQTAIMVSISGIIAWFLGIATGVTLVTSRRGGILENRWVFTVIDRLIDIVRSIPFIILIVLLIPV